MQLSLMCGSKKGLSGGRDQVKYGLRVCGGGGGAAGTMAFGCSGGGEGGGGWMGGDVSIGCGGLVVVSSTNVGAKLEHSQHWQRFFCPAPMLYF